MAVLDKKRTAMVKKLEELIAKLRRAFLGTYADALMELKSNIENGADFTWKDNPIAEKKIDQMIDMLTQKSNAIISNGVTHYQQYGTQSALDALRERARQIAAKYGNQKFINRGATDEIKALDKEATNQRRIDAVGGHSRTIANRGGGMNNLSNRVWSLNDQVKKEIEIIVQDSIRKGYSTEYAIKLAQKYLNNPNEIDAWKKDENGEWYQTPAAKDYHPGRGVYKSAIKNVERMIRTETMAAYRTAEIEKYQKNPMVKGYRIQLSSNHTTTHGHHGVKKISDICDRLQGDYPKSFVWTGWHPNCRCVLIPIMLTDEEFAEYLKAKREGKLDEFAKKTNIQDFPKNITEWMDENEDRIQETISNPQKELPVWTDSVMKESGMENKRLSNNKPIKTQNDVESAVNYLNTRKGGFFSRLKQSIIQKFRNIFNISKLSFEAIKNDWNINFDKSIFENSIIKDLDLLKIKSDIETECQRLGMNIKQFNCINNNGKYTIEIIGDGFYINREIYRSGDILNVNNNRFEIYDKTKKGKGFAKNIMRSLVEQFINIKIDRINIYAGLDDGPSVWPKYGFWIDEGLGYDFIKNIKPLSLQNEVISFLTSNKMDLNGSFCLRPLFDKFGVSIFKNNNWFGHINLKNKKEFAYMKKYLDL